MADAKDERELVVPNLEMDWNAAGEEGVARESAAEQYDYEEADNRDSIVPAPCVANMSFTTGRLRVGKWEVWYHTCSNPEYKSLNPFMADMTTSEVTHFVSAWNASALCEAIGHSDPATVKAVSALAPRRLSEGRTDA